MSKLTILALLIVAQYRPIILNSNYQHDKWQNKPTDIVKRFSAYTVSFDGKDDDYALGVPEWVAYEIKPLKGKRLGKRPESPNVWISERRFPADASYRNSEFDRGQMCAGFIAWRLGKDAYWNTHTILNACPQFPVFHRGIWFDLEKFTVEWADKTGQSVWVICGPVFMQMAELSWIGEKKDVAVPDAFYKIIVQEQKGQPDVMAFMYPHLEKYSQKGPYHHAKYLVSVNYIEMLTGLDFLTVLEDKLEERIESRRPRRLWGELSKK